MGDMEERQQALEFEPHTLVRKHDPITSRDAAESVEDFRGGHWKLILNALRFWSGGLTSQEIEGHCSLDYWAVARRMGELETAGKVVRTQETRKNRSGHKAIVWALVG